MLQGLSKKLNFSVFGGNFRKDINGLYKHVTKNWMKLNHDDRVKDWCPEKNSNLIVKLENDAVVDDQDLAKSIIPMPCQPGSYILGHSRRLVNNVIRDLDVLYSNDIYYGDADSAYIHRKQRSGLVDYGFVGKTLGLGKDDYGNAGNSMFNSWALKRSFAWLIMITEWFWLNAVLKLIAKNIGWKNSMISYGYREEKPYQAGFRLIRLKCLKK